MTRIVQLAGRARCAITAAMSAGILSIAACGAVSTEMEQTEPRTSALTVSTMQSLLDGMRNNPTGSILLNNDLNASGFAWHLGYFAGTLDGGNHTISNLTTSDTIGQAAAMVVFAENAIIKNLKLTNLHVSGTYDVGGLVGDCVECAIDNVAVEGTLTGISYCGGIVAGLSGGHISQSYFKGTVNGCGFGIGGLVGRAAIGSTDFATITNSYAQAASQTLVAASTTSGIHPAGGIVGFGTGVSVHDVYAVGNVTGRGSVGGIIGQPACDGANQWLLYKSIYRGNVTDSNLPPPGGWAGVVGAAIDSSCAGRFAGLFFNSQLDTSTTFITTPPGQRASTTSELQTPTTASGGIFCLEDPFVQCGDNPYSNPPWLAGTNTQYHALANMPGPNVQPRSSP